MIRIRWPANKVSQTDRHECVFIQKMIIIMIVGTTLTAIPTYTFCTLTYVQKKKKEKNRASQCEVSVRARARARIYSHVCPLR